MDYCRDQLRQHDYELYATMLFAPAKHQSALAALYTLNLELEKIPFLVREPMMGLIRFQWWRDAISSLYRCTIMRHKVIETLGYVLGQGVSWSESDFQALINVHEEKFKKEMPFYLNDLADYSTRQWGILLGMACELSGSKPPNPILESIIASAYGMTREIKKIPSYVSEGKLISQEGVKTTQYTLLNEVAEKVKTLLSGITFKDFTDYSPLLVYFIALKKIKLLQKTDFNINEFIEKDHARNLAFYLLTSKLKTRLLK